MMEEQVGRTRAQVEGVRRMKGVIDGLLKEMGNEGPNAPRDVVNGDGEAISQEEEWKDEQRAIWRALEEDLAV